VIGSEILERANPPAPEHGAQFGSWKFNAKRFTLDNGYFEVDLERMADPISMLDEILRFAHKTRRFLPDEDLGALVRAVIELSRHYARFHLVEVAPRTKLGWRRTPRSRTADRRAP
jgi:hypothetical protein